MTKKDLYSHINEATNDVARVTDAISIGISLIILVAGIILFYISFQFGPDADELAMLCLLLGLFGGAIGLILLAVRNTKLVFLPTMSRLKKKAVYFKRGDEAKVEQLAANSLEADELPKSDANGVVRIDMLLSSDTAFAAAQVFSCTDYMYNPVGDIHIYTGSDAKLFITKIRQITR